MQTIPYSKHCNVHIYDSAIELKIEGNNRAEKVKEVFVSNFKIPPLYEDILENPGWVTLGFSRENVSWEVFTRHFKVITPDILVGYPH
jgi:hypothetical protein